MPDTLPGSNLTQQQLDRIIAVGPAPGETWDELLLAIHPVGLNEVPIWYDTVVTNALRAGHITESDAQALLTATGAGTEVAPPKSLLQAWDDLMAAFAVVWPKRRQAASGQLQRMNVAVSQAQRRLGGG